MATRFARSRPKLRQRSSHIGEVPRKVYIRVVVPIRTANRHWWIGREDQSAQEKHGLGTRQNSGRNFGIRPSRRKAGFNKRLHATVYQKHSSLQKRKLKYRGRSLASVRTLRKWVIDLRIEKLATEALMNAGDNYNRPKVGSII